MSKAVLVMEMPEKCYVCPFLDEYDACLVMDVSSIEVDAMKEKPDWCTLKLIPEKKTENYRSEFARGIKKGWNDAIKVIDSEV